MDNLFSPIIFSNGLADRVTLKVQLSKLLMKRKLMLLNDDNDEGSVVKH